MRFVLAFVLVLAAGCSKGGDGSPGGQGGAAGGAGSGGGGSEAAAPTFEERAFEFKYSQFADGRRMLLKIGAKIPVGWRLMTEGASLEMMNTFMPVKEGEKPDLLSGSSLTISATCHGQCVAAKLPEQAAALAAQRQSMLGAGAKIVQDAEVRPGVRVYVVEVPGASEADKKYGVGATHWLPGQDSAAFCEGLLQGEQAQHWEAIRDACTNMHVTAVDPLVGAERAEQERANLAKCPAATTVKHTPKEPTPETTTPFSSVPSVRAEAGQPGSVTIYLSSVAMAAREDFWKKDLAPGEAVANLTLTYDGEGEVLSGKFPAAGEGTKVRVSAGLRITGGVTLQLAGNAESFVEVVARTPDKICGRFRFADDWRTLEGEFTADILPTR